MKIANLLFALSWLFGAFPAVAAAPGGPVEWSQIPAAIGWNVVYPTNTAADVTTLQTAVNGSMPVLMEAGTWQVCSQVTMPANQHLEGVYTSSNPGSIANSQTFSKTVVACPNNGTFSSGQAFFALKDHDVIRGLDIYCNFGSSPSFNGINALNAVAPEIDHNSVYFCKEGISRYSDGSVTGFSVAYSQLARIHDNLLYEETDHGYYADFANGGFVSDEQIGPNNDFTLSTNSQVYLHDVFGVAVFSNRIEDAGVGLQNAGGTNVTFVGNMCDKIACILASAVQGFTVTGNYGNYGTGGNNFGGLVDVEFAGTNTDVQFAANQWENPIAYKADAGATLAAATFSELPSTGTAIFNDAYTQATIQPLMATNNAAVSSLVPPINPFSQVGGMHVSSRGFTPAVSSCGSGSPSVVGDDTVGTITLGTGSPTACTLTFAAAFAVTPQCDPTTSSTSSTPDVSAISATAVTFTLSATATKIYYQCFEQIPNLMTGGVGLTSAWTTTRSTLTTAGGTAPDGTTTAAKLIEDGTSANNHVIGNTVSAAAGTYTISAYIHSGNVGTDGFALVVEDSAFTNIAGAAFSAAGVYQGSVLTAGTGSIISTGSQAVSGGWFRVWMTYTLGVAAPANEYIFMAQGPSVVFTGNSTNNVLVWGDAMRAGTLP